LLCALGAYSDSNTVNPFLDGTERRQLTEFEQSYLLEYIEKSTLILNEALEKAQGEVFDDALNIYEKAIKEVVIYSFNNKYFSELLMRVVLNQAMELVFGVSGASGSKYLTDGLLENAVNKDIKRLILEDSINLALKYKTRDIDIVKRNDVTFLPFVKLSFDRLYLVKKWLSGVIESKFQYEFLKTTLNQWLNVALNLNGLEIQLYAEELLEVDTILENEDGRTEAEDYIRQIRVLRKTLMKLIKSYENKDPDMIKEIAAKKRLLELKLQKEEELRHQEYLNVWRKTVIKRPLSVNEKYGCVITNSGLKCWAFKDGKNIEVPEMTNPTNISVGFNQICAIADEGVVCFEGKNSIKKEILEPIDISVGKYHTCAIGKMGLKCWANINVSGKDLVYGQLKVPELRNPKKIVSGVLHSCAVDDDGVKCWGAEGDMNEKHDITVVPSGVGVPQEIKAGDYHTCIVDDGEAICWGLNHKGKDKSPEFIKDIRLISLGSYYSCAVLGDKRDYNYSEIECWYYYQPDTTRERSFGGYGIDLVVRGGARDPTRLLLIESGGYNFCGIYEEKLICKNKRRETIKYPEISFKEIPYIPL